LNDDEKAKFMEQMMDELREVDGEHREPIGQLIHKTCRQFQTLVGFAHAWIGVLAYN
jgi:hypothetical protein